jgi:ABC-type multidrug transport system fused ATPase/permease subunit
VLVAVAQAEDVFLTPIETHVPVGAYAPDDMRGDVMFSNVIFAYDRGKKREVIKGVDFSVIAGQTIAFVGGSGAGKSTLMDLVSGYFFPKKGRVLVDGTNVKKWDLCILRRHIGIVPQELMLFNASVFENIRYGSFKAIRVDVERAAKIANTHEFIVKFQKGYNQIVCERGVKLSVG